MTKDICFSIKNGCSPYCTVPNGDKYVITEEKQQGKYVFNLVVHDKPVEYISFDDKTLLKEYILEKTKRRWCTEQHFSDCIGYFTTNYIYVVRGLTVDVRHIPDIVSGPYELYGECLAFAKKYIKELLDKNERDSESIAHLLPLEGLLLEANGY